MSKRNETLEERAARKAEVKQQKAEKKARREGHVEEDYGRKPCTLCQQSKDLLIRWEKAIVCIAKAKCYIQACCTQALTCHA